MNAVVAAAIRTLAVQNNPVDVFITDTDASSMLLVHRCVLTLETGVHRRRDTKIMKMRVTTGFHESWWELHSADWSSKFMSMESIKRVDGNHRENSGRIGFRVDIHV